MPSSVDHLAGPSTRAASRRRALLWEVDPARLGPAFQELCRKPATSIGSVSDKILADLTVADASSILDSKRRARLNWFVPGPLHPAVPNNFGNELTPSSEAPDMQRDYPAVEQGWIRRTCRTSSLEIVAAHRRGYVRRMALSLTSGQIWMQRPGVADRRTKSGLQLNL